jgi:hypothetical protein
MAEGLKSYIARRREEGQPLQFSNMGPAQQPESWNKESGSTYFRPEQTWNAETEAELRKPGSGFDYSNAAVNQDGGPAAGKPQQSRGYHLNSAMAELQKHLPGIVEHTLKGKKAPTTDAERNAVRQNVQQYFKMIQTDIEKQAKAQSEAVSGKEKEFEYFKGLSRSDKADFEKIYGRKGKEGGEKASFADKEQYKYLVGRLKELDGQLSGEFSGDLNDEERAKIDNDRQTILSGMMSLEDKMGGKGGMQRASSGSGTSNDVTKQEAIKQAVDAGAKKEDIINFIKQNPDASTDDFLGNFGVSSTSPKKKDEPVTPGSSQLSPRSEKEFKDWYKNVSDTTGLNPDPDDPKHFYDYRAAFLQGAEPNEEGHWPSEFKREGHPNMIVDGMNTKTGQPVEPPDMKNTPVNMSAQPSQGGLQRKNVPFNTSMTEGPTEEQKQAAHQELVGLANKLGVGPGNWKALGEMAKDLGGWAWESYTKAINALVSGQDEARKQLPAYRG